MSIEINLKTQGSDIDLIIPDWLIHALIALTSILLSIGIILTGGNITGRFKERIPPVYSERSER